MDHNVLTVMRTSSFAPSPRLGPPSAITPMISRAKKKVLGPILVSRVSSYMKEGKQMVLKRLSDVTVTQTHPEAGDGGQGSSAWL